MGDLDWSDAVRDESVQVAGPEELRRALPRWLKLSMFAGVQRVS